MSKKVSILHFFDYYLADEPEIVSFLGEAIELSHINCHGDLNLIEQTIKQLDGKTDAIALCHIPVSLRMGNRTQSHQETAHLTSLAKQTPVFDGATVRSAIERWGVRASHELEPGIWSNKRVLMFPSLNHFGLTESLGHYASKIDSADHLLYSGISTDSANHSDKRLLEELSQQPLKIIYGSLAPSSEAKDQLRKMIEWADVIAGDINTIAEITEANLQNKTIVTSAVSNKSISILRQNGANIIVTVLPNLSHDLKKLARHPSAVLEACLASVSNEEKAANDLTESDFLNLLSDLEWQPTITYIQPETSAVNRFGYITQPNSISEIRENIRGARFLPKAFIDRTAVHIPPVFKGRVENIRAKGKKHHAIAEVISLGGTPEEYTAQEADLVARRVLQASRLAEQLEARLIGCDTQSREINDAISAIASKTSVAATTGQALNILGTVQQAVEIAQKTSTGRDDGMQATVINPGDPIVSIAAEVIASTIESITLIGSEPDLLLSLKKKIEDIHLKSKVIVSTDPNEVLSRSDIILIGRTMGGKRVKFDPSICMPGAVICDYSQPSVITAEELAQRPDITLIESAVFELPTPTEGARINDLPANFAPASFAEASLLAINAKFIDFGLAGAISSKQVYEIQNLVLEHDYNVTGIMAYGKLVPQAELDHRVEVAEKLADQGDQITPQNEYELNVQPDRPSIRRFAREHGSLVATGLGAVAVLAGILGWVFRRKRNSSE